MQPLLWPNIAPRFTCSCRFSYLRLGEVCRVRGAFVEGGVRALCVVEADPVVNDPFGLVVIQT